MADERPVEHACAWARSPSWRWTNRVAMRIRFDGAAAAPEQMYFRGPVLTRFDGREWRPLGLPFAAAGVPDRLPTLQPIGQPVRYEVDARAAAARLGCRCSKPPPRPSARSTAFASAGATTCNGSASGRSIERIRVKAEAYPRYTPRHRAPLGASPREPRAAAGLQSAHRRLGPAAARRAANSQRRRDRTLAAAGAAPHPHRRLQLHAGARRVRPQRHRRVLARPQDGLLRALRRRLRGGDAGGRRFRRASSPATRAPTPSRSTATGSCARATPTPGPRSGRPARAGSASTRPAAVAPDRIGSAAGLQRRSRGWWPARSRR